MTDSLDEHGLALWPAPERNKRPIAEAMRPLLEGINLMLELASGTGQHAAHFVHEFPHLIVQTSDVDPTHLETLARRAQICAHGRLLPPLRIDVMSAEPLKGPRPDLIYCANMIHIAPPSATSGLFGRAAAWLDPGSPLVLYGPFSFSGVHTSESNREFDEDLRRRNAEFGVRDFDLLAHFAEEYGFASAECIPMPRNNHLLVWRRRA